MSAGVPALPLGLDPLIAEAKRRMRRRRLVATAALLAVAAGTVVWAAVPSGKPGETPAVGQLHFSAHAPSGPVEWVGTGGGVAWAGTYRNLWLSTNGGRTWGRSTPPHLTDVGATSLGDVQFVDSRHGWLSSNTVNTAAHTSHRWEIDRTTDGGRTWQASTPPDCKQCNFGNLSFFDATRGYVFAWASTPTYASPNARTKLFSTSDGGATWKLVSEPRIAPPAGARFVDPQHGVAVSWSGDKSADSRVFRTSDGGRTWTPVVLDGSPRYPGYFGYPEITSVDGTLVIPAERFLTPRGAQPTVYTSSDGGAHWQAHSAPKDVFFGYGLFSAASPDTWVAADRYARHFYETTDGGESWRVVTMPRTFLHARWIHFSSAQLGWAILENYRLVRTTDGGRHWTSAGPPKPKVHTRG